MKLADEVINAKADHSVRRPLQIFRAVRRHFSKLTKLRQSRSHRWRSDVQDSKFSGSRQGNAVGRDPLGKIVELNVSGKYMEVCRQWLEGQDGNVPLRRRIETINTDICPDIPKHAWDRKAINPADCVRLLG